MIKVREIVDVVEEGIHFKVVCRKKTFKRQEIIIIMGSCSKMWGRFLTIFVEAR